MGILNGSRLAVESIDSDLADVVAEITDRINAGQPVNFTDYAERCPGRESQLRDLVEALRLVDIAGGSAPVNQSEDAPPHQALGDFRIIREVGRGGMGVVYEAEQLSLGRRVALKVLPYAATMDPKQLQRFHNEARAAASLHHEHIVPVFAVGCERAVHFYAMQFIDGVTLAQVIVEIAGSTKGRGAAKHKLQSQSDPLKPCSPQAAGDPTAVYLPPSPANTTAPLAAASTLTGPRDKAHFHRVAELGIQAAEALEHAHSMGVVHRDIKPANLILGAGGKLWVTDFGLARTTADSGMTVSGDLIGTLRYMSPEQALARHGLVDHRTDIYALGATLYELLTGKPVVSGEDKQEILRQIAFDEPVAPRKLNRTIPTDLETIVLKAIEKNPSERYASAGEMAEDLRRHLDNQPVQARRPSLAQRATKWSRRHKPVVWSMSAAALVALVGLTAGLIVMAGFNRRLDKTNDDLKHTNAHLDASLKEVEQERKNLLAVNEFVNHDLLGQADIGNQPFLGEKIERNPNITVAELLDRAAEKIEGKFKDQPLTEGSIRMTLADAYRALGRYAESLKHSERSVAIFKQQLGSDHPDALRSMGKLANSYLAAGRTHEAIKLFEETLRLMKAKLGADHRTTISIMHNLATSYAAAGRSREALELREETRRLMKAKLGPDHPDTLSSMDTVANSYFEAGRTQEAIELREEALRLMKAKLGPDHPNTLRSMNNLANSYFAAGRTEEALKLREEALPLMKINFGPEHPETLGSIHNLALSYFFAGRRLEALKLFEETFRLAKAKLGPDHPDTLRSMDNVANGYAATGRSREALKLREEALPLMKAKLGPDHPETLRSMNNLANSYSAVGRTQDALKLFEETLRLMKAKLGPDHLDTLRCMNNLANLCSAVGRTQDALKLFEVTLPLVKAKLGPDHPDTVRSANSLADFYCAVGRFQDALKLFEERLRLLKAKLGPDHPDTLMSMNNLAWLLSNCADATLRDPKRAVELAQVAVKFAPKEWRFWNTLGVAQYRAGDLKAAIAGLQKSIELSKAGNAYDFFFLAMAHQQLGGKAAARIWYNKAVVWMQKNASKDEQLDGFRAEARNLLKIPEDSPAKDGRTTKQP